jgi:hypothetical protein
VDQDSIVTCFTHSHTAAVGMCGLCQKGICRECVAADMPRLVCRACAARGSVLPYGWYGWYGYGYEYRSAATIAGWPLIHACAGVDPVTMRPRIAKGVVAIGNVAIGVLAIGGLAFGLFTVGGVSFGLLLAMGGVALGLGVSVGGVAIGSIAFGGVAVGLAYAVGGAAFGPAVIDGQRCDDAARVFLGRWLDVLPPTCR